MALSMNLKDAEYHRTQHEVCRLSLIIDERLMSAAHDHGGFHCQGISFWEQESEEKPLPHKSTNLLPNSLGLTNQFLFITSCSFMASRLTQLTTRSL